jgi:hypothetical protein
LIKELKAIIIALLADLEKEINKKHGTEIHINKEGFVDKIFKKWYKND